MGKCSRYTVSLWSTVLFWSTAVVGCVSYGREAIVGTQQESVVFTAEESQRFFPRLGRCDGTLYDTIDGTWSISRAEAHALDQLLYREVRKATRANLLVNAEEYRFQYYGIILNGRRRIYINALHSTLLTRMTRSPEKEWSEGPVVVCDAGMGAFQADYEVATRHLSALRFSSSYGP